MTLVADPDGLLLEEGINREIRNRGFDLIPFDDHISFRYLYESQFRKTWDLGEKKEVIVIVHAGATELDSLPYDLLQDARRLSFNLGDLFPNLRSTITASLELGDLDVLYNAYKDYATNQLGDNATKEFILRHVFGIAPELIKTQSDLLLFLLRRHYRRQQIPAILEEHLIQILRRQKKFGDLPIEILIPNREVFFAFLQERWPFLLDKLAAQDKMSIKEDEKSYRLEFPGPLDIPFDHADIRVYIDNLFLEGMLTPVDHEQVELLSKTWASIGIHIDAKSDHAHRLDGLIKTLQSTIPSDEARHGDWLHYARQWAELVVLQYDPDTVLEPQDQKEIYTLRSHVDAAFSAWSEQRYEGLINLPAISPVMLHHIPRFLARSIVEKKCRKAALIVVDGLSLDQWIVVRQVLFQLNMKNRFSEGTVFSWIPTITSVARQAIFAGKPPIYFPETIHTTEKEPSLWRQFWLGQGLAEHEVAYAKSIDDKSMGDLEDILTHPKLRVIGLIINKVDKIMHGMELGTAGMHNQVQQWAQQTFITNLFNLLHTNDFDIWLTSDHGNIEATGCGRPTEGVVADLRGERVRVYSDPQLFKQTKGRFPDATEWRPISLPEGYLPLLAPDRFAFVPKGNHIICHGGITVEEVIVPFIKIERKDA